MSMRHWISRHRILSAWVLIAALGGGGWAAGTVYVDRYVESLDREEVCANVRVALRDTTIIGAERARADSAALADRNCTARIEVARQGRRGQIFLPLGLLVAASVLVMGLVTLGWIVRRAWRRLRN
jgi:hypothetical protein